MVAATAALKSQRRISKRVCYRIDGTKGKNKFGGGAWQPSGIIFYRKSRATVPYLQGR